MFMERHWDLVTKYLASAVTQEIATLIDVYKTYPQGADRAQLRRIAQERLGLVVDFLPETQLPPPGPKPFFSELDVALSDQIRRQIGLPFWIDTVGRSSIVEIRIKLDDTIMRVFARRADVYDPNSWMFLVWMVATSLVVLTVAILFLRNQIRPIVRLADAAEAFGKGPRCAEFPPARCARGPSRRGGVPGDEGARRTLHRAAHHHAGRRVARSAHDPHPLQAGTGFARRGAGDRCDQKRRR